MKDNLYFFLKSHFTKDRMNVAVWVKQQMALFNMANEVERRKWFVGIF
ncbi:hypothetical protein IGI49_002846 [Enterococcus sp. AZ071]